MLSFWEKQSFLNYDHIIIGGGIVGLSTAARLKEINPEYKVLVLERGFFPAGASTKNAGFACFGSPTELLSDLKILSEEEVLALVNKRWQGLQLLRKRLGDEGIGLLNNGGYEVVSSNEIYCLEHIDRLNQLLKPVFGQEVYQLRDDLIAPFGFAQHTVKHLVRNHFEGQIDTGKMMQSLIGYVQSLGVQILTNAEVSQFHDDGKGVSVEVKGLDTLFYAKQVGVCTNAFSQALLGDKLPQKLKPGRGLVLATAPIAGLPFKGVFHIEEGFYYFRNHGNRVIFGGGRNMAMEEETTTEFGTNPLIYDSLEKKLKEVILPKVANIEITDIWSGIMAFGEDKQPIRESISPRVHLAIRLGGMGVAIGSGLAEDLANTLCQAYGV